MFRSRVVLVLFIIEIFSSLALVQRQNEDEERLRYSVILSEPLESTLEWDNDGNDETKLILQWNITLKDGFSGILAFSNYDLNLDHLDMIIFGNDEKLYNGYTDENGLLFLPKNPVKLTWSITNSVSVDQGRKKRYTIEIIRPLDTCEREGRNYIIDRGTIHLLTGTMAPKDFQKFKRGESVQVEEKKMSLTLQRVQLMKSQVRLE